MRAKLIDVSRYQGDINFQKVEANEIIGVVIRCTIGNYYTDNLFQINWQKASDTGLKKSIYHVIRPDNTAQSQIARLQNEIKDKQTDFPIVLDVEVDGGQNNATCIKVVKECLDLLYQWRKQLPIIYTAKWWWDAHMYTWGVTGKKFPIWTRNYPLWVAQYPWINPPYDVPENVAPSIIPGGWEKADWRIWQWTDKSTIPGVVGNVDKNVYNGNMEQFSVWCSPSTLPTTTPVNTFVKEYLYPEVINRWGYSGPKPE